MFPSNTVKIQPFIVQKKNLIWQMAQVQKKQIANVSVSDLLFLCLYRGCSIPAAEDAASCWAFQGQSKV